MPDLAPLLDELRARAASLELPDATPVPQFGRMAAAGVTGWVIPEEFGGLGLSDAEVAAGYERLAAADLTATFALTQRNAAVGRVVLSANEPLRAELLPRLAANELWATVGISHLTTSRQHTGTPAVVVREEGDGYRLTGTLPWVTGAEYADLILAGGQLPDGRQLLALIDRDADGVTLGEPPRLLALNASRTGSVELEGVRVAADRVVAGPVEAVMKSAGGGAGSVTTSALAVGRTAGTLDAFRGEAEQRPELGEIIAPFARERAGLSDEIRRLSSGEDAAGLSAESIRERANSLVLRSAQAYLAASKGAGFVAGHPAERAVRESIFFLVWSCPAPVVNAALRGFACLG